MGNADDRKRELESVAGVPGLSKSQAERLASQAMDDDVDHVEFLRKIEKLKALKELAE